MMLCGIFLLKYCINSGISLFLCLKGVNLTVIIKSLSSSLSVNFWRASSLEVVYQSDIGQWMIQVINKALKGGRVQQLYPLNRIVPPLASSR